LKVFVLAFGKLKVPGLRASADYYAKLCGSWFELEEIELKPLSVPDKSPATRQQIQAREGALLLEKTRKLLSARGIICLLDEMGKAQSTARWAELLTSWRDGGTPEVALCIGSSLGFSDDLRKAARVSLSLGAHTLPHELARVVLLEQLYRAGSVVHGHPYHNEGS
jgi:23S rRNA (pseudouridine1915-N3)-methyltransferase